MDGNQVTQGHKVDQFPCETNITELFCDDNIHNTTVIRVGLYECIKLDSKKKQIASFITKWIINYTIYGVNIHNSEAFYWVLTHMKND